MKRIHRAVAALLLIALLLPVLTVSASAGDPLTKEIRAICLNVAGLPSFGSLIGMPGADVGANQQTIGKMLAADDFDLIAVQEDFGYHKRLAAELTAYPYQTVHSGGVPGGDGMNVFSKTKLYNEKRTPWDMTAGVIHDGDELTPKGILYTLVDLGDGMMADLYVIHADAFGDEKSQEARASNYRQLADMIAARSVSRPVIITGDFNTSSHLGDGGAFTQTMIAEAGFKDAWTELYNGGDYADYSTCPGKYGADYWGKWDSVEKFLYRDGGGIHVDVTDFSYRLFEQDGTALSDHCAAVATIRFTATQEFVEGGERTKVKKYNFLSAAVRKVVYVVRALFLVLTHLDELAAILRK